MEPGLYESLNMFQPVKTLFQGEFTATTPVSEASTSTMNGFNGFGCFKMMNEVLSFSKASLTAVFYTRHLGPFFIRDMRGVAMELNPWINI